MKHTEQIESPFVGHNIYENGCGKVAFAVMTNPSISFKAKALYSYFCTFTDDSGNTEPTSSQKICEELGFSKKTFNKYLEELKAFGLVSVETIDTHFGKQMKYRISHEPVVSEIEFNKTKPCNNSCSKA